MHFSSVFQFFNFRRAKFLGGSAAGRWRDRDGRVVATFVSHRDAYRIRARSAAGCSDRVDGRGSDRCNEELARSLSRGCLLKRSTASDSARPASASVRRSRGLDRSKRRGGWVRSAVYRPLPAESSTSRARARHFRRRGEDARRPRAVRVRASLPRNVDASDARRARLARARSTARDHNRYQRAQTSSKRRTDRSRTVSVRPSPRPRASPPPSPPNGVSETRRRDGVRVLRG